MVVITLKTILNEKVVY